MPRVSLVGNGHGGSEDYATLALWWTSESSVDYGVGNKIEAACLGYCGASTSISGTTPRGYHVYSQGTQFDGTNKTSLAVTKTLALSSSNGVVEDILIQNNGNAGALVHSASDTEVNRCYIEFTEARALLLVQAYDATTNRVFNKCIVDATNSTFSDVFYTSNSREFTLNNCSIFGGGDSFYSTGSSTLHKLVNCFVFDSSGNCYGAESKVNCASQDGTGSTGWTGYTSAELVNFAGGDFRTKSTSDLADDGAGGFIGAFLETSAGISLTATLGTIEYNSNDSVVSLAGSVDVTATLGSINYSSNDTLIQVSGDVNVIATLGAIDYTSNDTSISIFGNVDIVATLGTINYNSNDTVISLAGGINVSATLGVIDYASNDSVIILQGQIPVTATLGAITYDSYNVTVQIGTGQFIGTVTAGFANDIYSAGFKPSAITVNFKS